MKAHFEQLLIPQNEVFVHKYQALEAFTARHHFHPELELHLVTEGWGMGYVADQYYRYEVGDLILLGSMVPHHWESAPHFAEHGVLASSHYIQFSEQFLGQAFFDLQASERLISLFRLAKLGIRFFGDTASKVKSQILNLSKLNGLRRLILFLQILDELSLSLEYELVLPEGYQPDALAKADERIRRVNAFVHKNLTQPITLEQAASEASMSKSAFCRFFKARTLRTFSDYVNELRIYHAIRLMQEKKLPVAQAALESGFNNLGYFHQTYKRIRGISPGIECKWK